MFNFNESEAGKDAPESFKIFSFAVTGDFQETDNPHRNIPQAIVEQMHELHIQSLKGSPLIIKKLERLIAQYPKVPALYNYLSVAYIAKGNTTKFDKLNEMLIKDYPGYPVSRINQAMRHIMRSEFDKAEALLGNGISLNNFLPNRQIYHISEVVQFYETVVRLFIHKRQFDAVDNHIKLLKEISGKFDGFHKDKIKQLEAEKVEEFEEMRIENYSLYEVEDFRKPWVAKSETMPIFTHPEILWLYEYSLEIPKEKIEALLALPRPTLIQDLNKVLDDAMARFDYFFNQEWDDATHSFPTHALFILAELRATESLSHCLNLIRQDDEWTTYWCSDMITETFPIHFYKMLGADFSVLKQYLLEPNNNSFQRMVIPTAISILAYHHPERRQECIGFMEDILNDFYDNRRSYKDIIDMELNESIVSDLLDLQSKDSYPVIEKLYLESMISDGICGDLDEIKETLDEEAENHFFFHDTIPTIFEDYKDVAGWGKPVSDKDRAVREAEIEENGKKIQESNKKMTDLKKQIAHLEKHPKADLPKAGRNDPCTCGSGKKYKKCCGA